MVYFICQGCQETLKKPAVRKHVQGRCRGAFMTCVDCGACFHTNDATKDDPDAECNFGCAHFDTHNQCISEEKKYQGDCYVEKGGGVPKGRAKQDSWIEAVGKAIEGLKTSGEAASGKILNYLEKMSAYDNIPRKQKAFTNFVKNSCGVWDAKTAGEIFAVLEKYAGKDAAAGPKGGANAQNKRRRWAGWEAEISAEISEWKQECKCSGSATWKAFSAKLADRYQEQAKSGVVKKRPRTEVVDLVLSNIPDANLCAKTSKILL